MHQGSRALFTRLLAFHTVVLSSRLGANPQAQVVGDRPSLHPTVRGIFDSLESRNDLHAVPFPCAVRLVVSAYFDWRMVLCIEFRHAWYRYAPVTYEPKLKPLIGFMRDRTLRKRYHHPPDSADQASPTNSLVCALYGTPFESLLADHPLLCILRAGKSCLPS